MSSMPGSLGDAPRTEGSELAVTDPVHGTREQRKNVWVALDRIYLRDPGTPVHVNGAGIDMTGEVPGRLSHWIPTVRGDWVGLVNFAVRYADGRRNELVLRDQLVPGYALRPRQ